MRCKCKCMNRKKAFPAVQADFNVKDTKLVLPFQ